MKLTRDQYLSGFYIIIFVVLVYVAFLFNQDYKPLVINKNFWTKNNHVYYKMIGCGNYEYSVEIAADPKTVHIYNKYYFGDKNKLWNTDGGPCAVPTEVKLDPPVDIESFKVISPDTNLAQDIYGFISIYRLPIDALGIINYDSFRINNFDAYKTSYISNNILTKDGKIYYYDSYYYHEKTPTIKELVGVTGNVLHVYESQDLASCLYIVTTLKVFSFCPYAPYANNSVFEISDADPITFHKLKDNNYWADDHNIFFKGKKLEDAVSSDFIEIKGSSAYYFSNGHIYVREKKIADVSSPDLFTLIKGQPTFKTGGCGSNTYWTNGKKVYVSDQILDLDPENVVFTTYPGFKCVETGYVYDHNNFYFETRKIENVDPTSFRIVTGRHARDKNHFYSSGFIMDGNPDDLEKDAMVGKLDKVYDVGEVF